MDAVQSSVRQLHGSISIVSRVGQGSMFSIKLPSSLMVSKGILFECGGQPYVLPAEGIRQMEKVRLDRIRQFQDVSVASIRGTLYPVFWLTRLLGLVPTHDADHVSRDDEVNAVILSTPGGEVAVIVDRFVAQVEVVVKPLSEGLNSLLIFQGATILGDGRVALVLDPTQLETAVDTTRSTTCGNLERAAG